MWENYCVEKGSRNQLINTKRAQTKRDAVNAVTNILQYVLLSGVNLFIHEKAIHLAMEKTTSLIQQTIEK